MESNIDISQVVLQTDRLVLRPWQQSDVDDFFQYASVDGVGEMAGWKHHETIAESQKILDDFIAGKNVFAVVCKENNKVIGSLGLHRSWVNDDAMYKDMASKEIGYVLSKAYWGKRLMPEAVRAVIDFCFNSCGVEVLTCGHFAINAQSQRVIEKCGFSFVKKGEYYAKQLEKTFVDWNYILLRPEKAGGL